MKKILSVIFALLMIFGLASCKMGKDKNGYPFNIDDAVIAAKPKKIAVTSAALREGLTFLGYADRVVDASEVFASGLGDVTGGDVDVSVVLTNEELYPMQKEALENTLATVAKVSLPKSFDEIQEYWRVLAKVANGQKGEMAADIKFAELSEKLKPLTVSEKKKAVMLTASDICAVSGLEAEALVKAGYENAAAEFESPFLKEGQLLSLDPEIIFCAKGMKESFVADKEFTELSAVKNNMVFEIDVYALRFATDKYFQEVCTMYDKGYNDNSLQTENSSLDVDDQSMVINNE